MVDGVGAGVLQAAVVIDPGRDVPHCQVQTASSDESRRRGLARRWGEVHGPSRHGAAVEELGVTPRRVAAARRSWFRRAAGGMIWTAGGFAGDHR